MSDVAFHSDLTKPDLLILQNLAADIQDHASSKIAKRGEASATRKAADAASTATTDAVNGKTTPSDEEARDAAVIATLSAMNDPSSAAFEPTVLSSIDVHNIRLPAVLDRWVLTPYIRAARSAMRVETDVVMATHLLLYVSTLLPSAILLFRHFTWVHGVLHLVMQISYMGAYTLLMHQHIHMQGILAKRFAWFDTLFPYVMDPLMGHSWNSYYYHHVKHHHVEGNGPDDLSSTVRYQRDSLVDFLQYTGRFYFLIWFDLPMYFVRKGRTVLGAKAAFWELSWYATLYALSRFNGRATLVVFLLPLLVLRLGLMLGNWGQHAFVDHDEPDSDYRSSITLIDVPSNRYCYNDGYHTSHHLNPRRHWREHPVSFLKSKKLYADQHALVFHNIDYLMITVRLLMKDYATLARCMVPIGDQMNMSMDDRIALLKSHTKRFTEEELRAKFKS